MADLKLSQLTVGTSVNPADLLLVTQAGESKAITVETLALKMPTRIIINEVSELVPSGALSTSKLVSKVSSQTPTNNYTLAAGTHGMEKIIVCSSSGGGVSAAVVTITNGAGTLTTVTLNNVGEYVYLRNIDGIWYKQHSDAAAYVALTATTATIGTLTVGTSASIPTLTVGTSASIPTLTVSTSATIPTLTVGTSASIPTLTVGTSATIPTLTVSTSASIPTLTVGTSATIPTLTVGTSATIASLTTSAISMEDERKNVATIALSGSVVSTSNTILADATTGAIALNLPTAVSSTGRVLTVKKIDSSVNTVTLTPNGVETIDGAASKVLSTQYEFVKLQSDGTSWFIIG